jgi:hypothetical protein
VGIDEQRHDRHRQQSEAKANNVLHRCRKENDPQQKPKVYRAHKNLRFLVEPDDDINIVLNKM